MNDVINVVGISGGKDSTATALFAFENIAEPLRFMFCDTGIESPATYEYIDYLDEKLKALTGGGIERIKADFAEKMERKREKLIASGESHRAEFMYPTGNPFLDMCVLKGRFPSTKTRFCTKDLKLEPLKKFYKSLLLDGKTVISWSGERAEESLARSKKPVKEVLFKTNEGIVYTYRPILRWKEADCFAILKRYGIKPNPLYAQGFNRVGCFPCIMCRKAEIKMISELYPEVFEKLAEWELAVSKTSKSGSGTFFHIENGKETLADWIEWSKTSRGGKQYPLIFEE